MTLTKRLIIALIVGIVISAGAMIRDKKRNAEWVVSPQQIAEAQAQGKPGYETRPGTVAVLPIRSETADILPYTWVFFGLIGAAATFVVTRRRKA
ncbi:hypothetical protein F8A10_03450 [Paracoccus kondratievae]|uniref:Uncharacterized protein n=1 Tax=Paracoccus kondratievae TaxID=135740 RepID=A0AAD3P0B1_9RHOB|nr:MULTISPECIES: hypothetical protein [Paracoccus]QFQ86577.1 hypothetical protein F8A10_03450 [Paracoccus kondratievae]GLK65305.1 hypothetical protein GCM10017635_27790 [Paracoccus kondratievae]SMG08383.1 hypothetical protein SAMN02746000_00331 [Paracoccus sp. J56]